MTKRDLSKIFFIKNEIKMWERKLQEIDDESLIHSPSFEGMPGGSFNPESPQERRAIRKMEIKSQIEKLQADIAETELEITKWIATIDDSYMRQIIEYRCVDAMRWEDVVIALGYGSENSLKQSYKRFIDDYFSKQ